MARDVTQSGAAISHTKRVGVIASAVSPKA